MIFLGTPGMKEFLKRKHPEILQEHPRDWHEVITKDTWDEYDEWKQTDEGKRVIGNCNDKKGYIKKIRIRLDEQCRSSGRTFGAGGSRI